MNKSLPDEIDFLRTELYELMASFHKEKVRLEASYIDNLRKISSNFMALDPEHLKFLMEEVKKYCDEYLESVLPDKVSSILFRLIKQQVTRCKKCGGDLRPLRKDSRILSCKTCGTSVETDLVIRNKAGSDLTVSPITIMAALWRESES